MVATNIAVGSERYLFMMYRNMEEFNDGMRYVFCDELHSHKFLPYENKLKDVPGYCKNMSAFEDSHILLFTYATGKLVKIPCNIIEAQKKIYLTVGNFNKYWKEISERINKSIYRNSNDSNKLTFDSINALVDLSLIATSNRTVKINDNFVLEYKGKEIDIEAQRLISKRANALDDNKIKFVYAKRDSIVHDKSCRLVDKIEYWDFGAAEDLPEDMEICQYCKKKIYIRNAIQNDIKHFAWYLQFFEKGKVGVNVLEHFLQQGRAKLYMPAIDELKVKYGEDTWLIKTDKQGKYVLYHNNYVMVNERERQITSGFHLQKCPPLYLPAILQYIEGYDWNKHLETKISVEEKAVEQVNIQLVEEGVQKVGIWKRITNFFACFRKKSLLNI